MRSRLEAHNEIGSKLAFPDYYGKNLDALWDCLTSCIDFPAEIEWRNYGSAELALGGYAKKILDIFKEVDGVTIYVTT